jgi:hypothetical protein
MDGLVARRPGQNWDGWEWDVTIKTGDGRNKVVQGLHLDKRDVRFQEDNSIHNDEGALPGRFLSQ